MINTGRITLTATQSDIWQGMGNTNSYNNPNVQCTRHDFTLGNARKVGSKILTEATATANFGFISLLLLSVGHHMCRFYVFTLFYLYIPVQINEEAITGINQSKFLGLIIDKLSWMDHISFVCKKSLVVSEFWSKPEKYSVTNLWNVCITHSYILTCYIVINLGDLRVQQI